MPMEGSTPVVVKFAKRGARVRANAVPEQQGNAASAIPAAPTVVTLLLDVREPQTSLPRYSRGRRARTNTPHGVLIAHRG